MTGDTSSSKFFLFSNNMMPFVKVLGLFCNMTTKILASESLCSEKQKLGDES